MLCFSLICYGINISANKVTVGETKANRMAIQCSCSIGFVKVKQLKTDVKVGNHIYIVRDHLKQWVTISAQNNTESVFKLLAWPQGTHKPHLRFNVFPRIWDCLSSSSTGLRTMFSVYEIPLLDMPRSGLKHSYIFPIVQCTILKRSMNIFWANQTGGLAKSFFLLLCHFTTLFYFRTCPARPINGGNGPYQDGGWDDSFRFNKTEMDLV